MIDYGLGVGANPGWVTGVPAAAETGGLLSGLGSIIGAGSPLGLVSAGLGLAGLLGGGGGTRVNVSQQVSQVQAFQYTGGDSAGTTASPSTTQSTSQNQEQRTGVPSTLGGLGSSQYGVDLAPVSGAAFTAGATNYTMWLVVGFIIIAAYFLLKKKGG